TKLDENELLYDRVGGANFGKTELEVSSLVGAAYSNLSGVGGNNHYIPLGEVTSDAVVVPTRGPDWGDGGHWVRLKRHAYTAQDPIPSNGWNFCFSGITTCNRLIATLESLGTPTALAYIPELKVLRAIYYYWLLDWYGNVPLAIDFKDTKPPTNATRTEVYNFVEKELTENGPLLKKTGPNDASTYGRVNYYTAYACLSKLYMNAKVYTGTPQYEKAIAAADVIINDGKYSLTATYLDNFKRDNSTSSEFIWALPYDNVKFRGFNIPMMTLSYLNQTTYNINAQPWNGFATATEFYASYIDPVTNPGPQGSVVGLDPKGLPITGTTDKRLTNFIVGPQFNASGVRLKDDAADANDPDGKDFTFTPYINELEPGAWRQSGARIGKWQFYSGMTPDLDNDFSIFRYADILLTKAEALCRKNANWDDATAKAIVNQIRTQHGGVTAYTTMTEANFLAERGREMFCEGGRRQDMIRFGIYNNKFQFHDADASNHVNLYPIPATQLSANPQLKQNPGYAN
ncbi:MAG: RagB/SusD family nutrient uptake outer membrane protein, partial [Chitinophagaceae bacterium]